MKDDYGYTFCDDMAIVKICKFVSATFVNFFLSHQHTHTLTHPVNVYLRKVIA